MDWWLASFFLGAIFSLFLPIVPDFFVLFLLILLSIIFFCCKPLRLTSGGLFGASWMLFSAFNYQSTWQNNDLEPYQLVQKAQFIQGKVVSIQANFSATGGSELIKVTSKPSRFTFQVEQLNNHNLKSPFLIRLSWKTPSFAVQQGQKLELHVKFKPAHGLANLGSFSYQTWLRNKEILATGYVVNRKNNRIIDENISLRQLLYNEYSALLPEHKLSPLLLALGFGERSQLNADKSANLWHVLQFTGTGHLIAISGLHIGLVATASYFLVMLLVKLLPLKIIFQSPKLYTFNVRYSAIAISFISALIYAYLAGFSLPTLRAIIMLMLYWSARVMAIKISIWRWLLITLFIITISTPFSLFSASFWLSVYAVIIIFLALWRFKFYLNHGNKFWRFLKGLIVIQFSLTIMLLPITALFFGQVSVVAIMANMIAVPWMSFVTIPLCLFSVLLTLFSPLLSQILSTLTLESLSLLWQYLTWLANQPWSVVKLSAFEQQLLLVSGIVSAILLFFTPLITFQTNRKIKRGLAVLFVIAILPIKSAFVYSLSPINNKTKPALNWQLVVFDVGQGLSILLQQNGKAMLYDTGAAYASGFNMAESVILPYLQHQGILALDKVIISHSDNDHAGGLAKLQKALPIKELIMNDNPQVNTSTCQQGKSFNWQGLTVEMLWPQTVKGEENDDSCVLLVSSASHKVLLTGDISKQVEHALIEKYPQLDADVIVVPHHGSKTSSSEEFINHTSPQIAIVSAGFFNRWHMPVHEVVYRYQQEKVKLINTAEVGQIIFNFSNQGINVQNYHDDLWPFWFAK